LRGVKQVTRYLADGRAATYYYAWAGGPRLTGEPGTPEFAQSYADAHHNRRQPNAASLHSVIVGYKQSADFGRLRDRTKHDYERQIAKIEVEFGDLPIAALDDPRVTRDFLEWRDGMAASPRQGDYAWTVLMRVLSWARDRGITTYRPPDRVERLYKADRADAVWANGDIARFMEAARAPLRLALALALETGQRQGDLLILPWNAYDGAWIRLRQSKGGRKVAIPVTQRLRATLDAAPRTSPVILTSSTGRPWKPNAFRNAWADACRKAGIVGLTFHDLRGTAVTRLSEAGCSPQEIATITGHSLRDVGSILDRYSARTEKLAMIAMAKLEAARG
jgi:integrase